MTPAARLAEWLDVRPSEVRLVLLTFTGALFMMAFVVLSRALREAFFLDRFDASALPYVGGAAIGLGLVEVTPGGLPAIAAVVAAGWALRSGGDR